MTWYVGLTDDPARRRQEHGNPIDWGQTSMFGTELAARAWEKSYVSKSGYQGGPGGSGWHYGYWYTIAPQTRQ